MKQYVVVSPVLRGRYLQDEILTAGQIGGDLNRLLSIGAVQEISPEKLAVSRRPTIKTFILPTTIEFFAQWLAIATTRPLLPAFFHPDLRNHEFPIGDGKVTVSPTEPFALALSEGYHRVAVHSFYFGIHTISDTDLQKNETISFRIIPIDREHIKVQARCGVPQLQDYFEMLLTQIAVRWPDTDISNTAESSLPTSVIALRQLRGRERGQLLDALVAAFPTESALGQMVRHRLDQNLAAIAGSGTLQEVAFRLIEWAVAQGQVEALIQSAVKENPSNPQLKQVVQMLAQS